MLVTSVWVSFCRFYLNPSGRIRRFWDSVLLVFVLFNAVEVPFLVG